MDCEAIRNLFSNYVDRTLGVELKEALDQHLERCPACSRELNKFISTVQLLSSLPELPAPPDFLVSVRNRIERAPVWRQWLTLPSRAFSPGAGRALALAASFLLVFSIAFLIGRRSQTPDQTPIQLAKSAPLAEAWTPPEDPLAGIEWQIPEAAGQPRAVAVSTGFRIPDALEVEYTANYSRHLGAFPFQTPTELVIALIKADPALRFADLYPLPQGALALTPDYLFQITIPEPAFAQAPAIFYASGHRLPQNLLQAQRLYGLRIRRLASPLSPP